MQHWNWNAYDDDLTHFHLFNPAAVGVLAEHSSSSHMCKRYLRDDGKYMRKTHLFTREPSLGTFVDDIEFIMIITQLKTNDIVIRINIKVRLFIHIFYPTKTIRFCILGRRSRSTFNFPMKLLAGTVLAVIDVIVLMLV